MHLLLLSSSVVMQKKDAVRMHGVFVWIDAGFLLLRVHFSICRDAIPGVTGSASDRRARTSSCGHSGQLRGSAAHACCPLPFHADDLSQRVHHFD
jgi:hypothetical protein